jgi:hypothetical protein
MSYIGSKPANKPVVASDLDPAVITGQTALAVAPADTDEFLISDGGVLKRLDASLVGGTNTPAFSVNSSTAQTIANATTTKLVFGNELFDSDGKFASSRFTPTVAGKYFIRASVRLTTSADFNGFKLHIYKNGSDIIVNQQTAWHYETKIVSGIVVLDSDDYVEIFITHASGGNSDTSGEAIYDNFDGFRIIE